MRILNWRKGIVAKKDLDLISDKIEIRNFEQFKAKYGKYVVVKFSDQDEYLLGQIYKDVESVSGRAIWHIVFWDKVRDLNDPIYARNKQLVTEHYIKWNCHAPGDRIEEIYEIDSKYILFGEREH